MTSYVKRLGGGRILPGILIAVLFSILLSPVAISQIENVPVTNQVYEFLDRMGVKGILPAYSNMMIPLSRKEVAECLRKIDAAHDRLSGAESDFLAKFKAEFSHELGGEGKDDAVLFRDGFSGENYVDREKYLYTYADSSISLFVEFLGSLEYRHAGGDSYGSTSTTLEQHGGRIRGTLKDRLGYFLQGTDGTVFGDKSFALTDRTLQGSNKLKEATSTNFDFTEAYLRADLSWFNLEFGKERNFIGNGRSDQLLLSNNAPAFDLLKLDLHYGWFRFLFIHGSLVKDSASFPGTLPGEPQPSNKYLALHRFQFTLWDRLTLGLSEMTIYQRTSPEWAYLNPINFYKSAEHAMGDRDNSFLNFDIEYYPVNHLKLYSTLLVDDIDFSKLGTTWWGNELGMQGGVLLAEPLGVENVDVNVEYTRIEPYVYSNRTDGLAYTNNSLGLGHYIGPNSDQWFFEVQYRPDKRLRTWLGYSAIRHGDNIVENGVVTKNVGGNVLQGHRDTDSDEAPFLDGLLTRYDIVRLRAAYEPVNNLFFTGTYEYRKTSLFSTGTHGVDHLASIQVRLEY